jgi:hypothetical protein
MDYFDDETPELRATRSQILRYRAADKLEQSWQNCRVLWREAEVVGWPRSRRAWH